MGSYVCLTTFRGQLPGWNRVVRYAGRFAGFDFHECVTEFTFITEITLADTFHAGSMLTTINSIAGIGQPGFLPQEKHT
jgi:hypothetical protein